MWQRYNIFPKSPNISLAANSNLYTLRSQPSTFRKTHSSEASRLVEVWLPLLSHLVP